MLTDPSAGLGWGFNEKLTSAQMTSAGVQLPYAIDGHGGGAYAPSGLITIGGLGLTVSGPFTASGQNLFSGGSGTSVATDHQFTWLSGSTLRINGGATLTVGTGATFTVNTDPTFNGFPSFAGGFDASGEVDIAASDDSVWDLHAAITLESDGSITVKGSGSEQIVLADGICSVSSGATLTCLAGSTAAFQGTLTIGSACDCTVSAPLKMSGAGRIRKRRIAGVNADHTYAIADGNVIDIPTQSATHTYTISSTGAGDGDAMIFTMASDATSANANGIVLLRASDSTQIGASITKAAGARVWMEIVWDGSKWQPERWGLYST